MNSRKKYSAAGHYFHSCANKETTDHYLQSRCANKYPRATICTAMLPIRIHVSLIRTAVLRIAVSFHILATHGVVIFDQQMCERQDLKAWCPCPPCFHLIASKFVQSNKHEMQNLLDEEVVVYLV